MNDIQEFLNAAAAVVQKRISKSAEAATEPILPDLDDVLEHINKSNGAVFKPDNHLFAQMLSTRKKSQRLTSSAARKESQITPHERAMFLHDVDLIITDKYIPQTWPRLDPFPAELGGAPGIVQRSDHAGLHRNSTVAACGFHSPFPKELTPQETPIVGSSSNLGHDGGAVPGMIWTPTVPTNHTIGMGHVVGEGSYAIGSTSFQNIVVQTNGAIAGNAVQAMRGNMAGQEWVGKRYRSDGNQFSPFLEPKRQCHPSLLTVPAAVSVTNGNSAPPTPVTPPATLIGSVGSDCSPPTPIYTNAFGASPQAQLPNNTKPAKNCHICSRHAKNKVVAKCFNISLGLCRKIMCEKCLRLYDTEYADQALSGSSRWACLHCRGGCPQNSRCYQYQKNNKQRKEKNAEKKKAQLIENYVLKLGAQAETPTGIDGAPTLF